MKEKEKWLLAGLGFIVGFLLALTLARMDDRQEQMRVDAVVQASESRCQYDLQQLRSRTPRWWMPPQGRSR